MPGLRAADDRVRRAAMLGETDRLGAGGHAVRYREDSPRDLARARAAVAVWRNQNPAGTAGQLTAALGGQFHPDYGPVLRAVLFAADRHRARNITGVINGQAGAAP
jgi:hypothetical protein